MAAGRMVVGEMSIFYLTPDYNDHELCIQFLITLSSRWHSLWHCSVNIV